MLQGMREDTNTCTWGKKKYPVVQGMPNVKEFQFTAFSFNLAIPRDQACHDLYPEQFPLGWVQTRSALTSQPARKLFETKGSDTSFPSNKPGNKWYRNEVRKESSAYHTTESIYLPQSPFKERGGMENKGWYKAEWSSGVARYIKRFDRPLPAFSFFVSFT